MIIKPEIIEDFKRQRRAPYQPSAQRWEQNIAVKERAESPIYNGPSYSYRIYRAGFQPFDLLPLPIPSAARWAGMAARRWRLIYIGIYLCANRPVTFRLRNSYGGQGNLQP